MSMKCNDMEIGEVCYREGALAPRSLHVHHEYGLNADGKVVIVSTRYTDAKGVPVDTAAGTLSVGVCPTVPPQVAYDVLCDVQANGSVIEFERRTITSFDALNVATVEVTFWELADRTVVYVPTGTVAACNQDCDAAVPLGVLTTWG